MSLKTRPYDAADYLDSDEAVAAYLSEALGTHDAGLVADAMGAVARARGMSRIARAAGVSRASLYRTLSANGNPGLATILHILRLFEIRLSAVPNRRPRNSGRRDRARPRASKSRRMASLQA